MRLDHQVVIVGAGFGGMGAAIALQRAGVEDYVIFERADDLGGTWYVNHYPGLTVDIPSATYSYSFEPNPNWSHVFARGHELKAYCDQVAAKHDLRSHMRFGVTVTSARWDDDAGVWVVALADGSTVTTQHLITATGFLSEPAMPQIAGVETFAGTVVHTAEWDDSLDLTGRRVAVIGTGATSVQLVPTIARDVAELTVFQRTPIWVFPKFDKRISTRTQRLFRRFPATQRASHFAGWALVEALLVFGVLHYRQFGFFNAIAAKLATKHLHSQVQDPELRRKLTPSYTFGCKRPTVSNDYFPTFTRPHVHLETSPIEYIEPDAIVTGDGTRHEIDTLVLATGYNLWELGFPPFEIIGRDGRNLGKWWREEGFQAYLGSSVPKFPNLLTLDGPWVYSGLSYFQTLEPQMTIIERLFGELTRKSSRRWEVKESAHVAFRNRMLRGLRSSVFQHGNCAGAHSYYFTPSGETPLLRTTSTVNSAREAKNFPLSNFTFD
ncbi:MAG TPA: NAD(P)/FAD-dependent oxidoreductase [Aeromicrobium sp.]|nr:NAD(P)/FAD-dependent oxidoreductase [Aeromicrobium sp.]